MSELYLENEDNLNSIIVQLKSIIKGFSTLSRDKIENIIITANTIIKEGENNIKIMEDEINKLGIQQQFGSKLKNYKLEFQNLTSKFQSLQEKYINQKATNAIILGIDDENSNQSNKQKIELITNEEINNKSQNDTNNNSDIIGKEQIQRNFDSGLPRRFDNENNLGIGLNNSNLPDDIDLNIRNRNKSKFKIVVILIIIIIVLAVLSGYVTFLFSKKK